jgi:wobble nucleotide-excising tRNase
LNQQLINEKAKEPSRIVTLDSLGSILQAADQLIADANRQAQAHNTMVANLATEKIQLTSHVWAFLSKGELASSFATYNCRAALKSRNMFWRAV